MDKWNTEFAFGKNIEPTDKINKTSREKRIMCIVQCAYIRARAVFQRSAGKGVEEELFGDLEHISKF